MSEFKSNMKYARAVGSDVQRPKRDMRTTSQRITDEMNDLRAENKRLRESAEWNTRPDGWISVKDRLPDEMQDVIYFFEPVGVHIGKFKTIGGGACFYGDCGWLVDDVTHWMPLPGAPTP